jgi:hypothetical protein
VYAVAAAVEGCELGDGVAGAVLEDVGHAPGVAPAQGGADGAPTDGFDVLHAQEGGGEGRVVGGGAQVGAVVAEHGQPEGLRRELNALAHDVFGEGAAPGLHVARVEGRRRGDKLPGKLQRAPTEAALREGVELRGAEGREGAREGHERRGRPREHLAGVAVVEGHIDGQEVGVGRVKARERLGQERVGEARHRCHGRRVAEAGLLGREAHRGRHRGEHKRLLHAVALPEEVPGKLRGAAGKLREGVALGEEEGGHYALRVARRGGGDGAEGVEVEAAFAHREQARGGGEEDARLRDEGAREHVGGAGPGRGLRSSRGG